VGIMFQGKLMAMDTPSALKQSQLKGPAWNIVAEPLIPALEALSAIPGVHRAGLLGDHLHAITVASTHSEASLKSGMAERGFPNATIESAEPTLEDVFIELAGKSAVTEN
jgi:ABC-2 type transport system ATP-binding protein